MRFGERPDAFIDRGEADLDRAYHNAAAILKEDQVDPRAFEKTYGREAIQADLAYVEKRERKFEDDRAQGREAEMIHKYSTIFEGVLYEEIEKSNWLGEYAFTIRPSRYDDIRNEIDLVVEFRDPDQPTSSLGLAIDITLAKDKKDIQRGVIFPDLSKKIVRSKEEIQRDRLPEVKYAAPKGQKMPRVVVATDLATIKDLAELYLTKDTKRLADHPFQIRLLDQIFLQLKAQLDYAQGVPNSTAEREIAERLTIIERIRQLKEPLRKKHERAGTLGEDRDRGFLALYQTVDEHFALAA
jgi:hypothetical protein